MAGLARSRSLAICLILLDRMQAACTPIVGVGVGVYMVDLRHLSRLRRPRRSYRTEDATGSSWVCSSTSRKAAWPGSIRHVALDASMLSMGWTELVCDIHGEQLLC